MNDIHPAKLLSDLPLTPERRAAAIKDAEDLLHLLRSGQATRIGKHWTRTDVTGQLDHDHMTKMLVVEAKLPIKPFSGADLRFDPVALMLDVFNRQHPDTPVLVEYQPSERMPTPDSTPHNDDDGRPEGTGHLPAAGAAFFPEQPGAPTFIYLNIDVPMSDLPTVLAEELAHVVAGPDEGHGPYFQAVLEALGAEFEARSRVQNYERYTGPLPISVPDYLAGHPDRRLEIKSCASPDEPHRFVSFLYSEHGWPLSALRQSAPTEDAAREACLAAQLRYVTPRATESGLGFC
ncbi:hypothetical protein [Deinococcus xianganensis]|uniref:Uncharacterized protein n=1 Tax=Deinococcus xianganensis TaxID=1507289 RepID=A0A6I4YD43_9DEIO|nr:hypothetical protein [Deinococcus xianganensis]MXV20269.1 hypothetical protein [Deinococcus xianganensis]